VAAAVTQTHSVESHEDEGQPASQASLQPRAEFKVYSALFLIEKISITYFLAQVSLFGNDGKFQYHGEHVSR
jgi:hypothetical protein